MSSNLDSGLWKLEHNSDSDKRGYDEDDILENCLTILLS